MGRKFAVQERLSDEDFAAFNAYLLHQRTTIDDAVCWAKARGYRLARSSIGRYRKSLLSGGQVALWAGMDRVSCKRELLKNIDTLPASSLMLLGAFAAFLRNLSTDSGRTDSTAVSDVRRANKGA